MYRAQDAAISADSTSSATPSASEMGDSPPHESGNSPSSEPNFLNSGPLSTAHSAGAVFPPLCVGAESPSYSNGAVSPSGSTGTVSPQHCSGGAVSPAHSSEASYTPYNSASDSPAVAGRLGGDPNEEDGKKKFFFDSSYFFPVLIFVTLPVSLLLLMLI